MASLSLAVECRYYRAGVCGSCTELALPWEEQIAAKQKYAEQLIPAKTWLPIAVSRKENFRNKVKLVVSGSYENVQLGISDQDLRNCPLPLPEIKAVIPRLAEFIKQCKLRPYRVNSASGDLKYLLITASPSQELMVRFVVRRAGVQGIIRKNLPHLLEKLPQIKVVSLNIQPEHKAILEGEEEIILTSQTVLPFLLPNTGIYLELRPQSFFQTNTAQAEVLYQQAASWLAGASSAWDLYCGIGGFAFALAEAGVEKVQGVEAMPEAVKAANDTAVQLELAQRLEFVAADATKWILEQKVQPEALVLNPPRRGIGAELAQWVNNSQVQKVVYSSCNAQSLAKDLAIMNNFQVEQAQVVDMFAHTKHMEIICLLQKKSED